MNKNVLKSTFVALFAAIICVGCFMKIPIGVVPIVLQNALCILTAVLLGGVLGGAPTALVLVAGLIGLPVYAGGTSGIAVWMGPTGGFYPGYLLGAIFAGFIAGKPSVSEKKISRTALIRVSLGMFAGMVILYVPGVWRFASWAAGRAADNAEFAAKVAEKGSFLKYTMGACVIPYIPGDILKIVVSIPIALKVRPVLAQYLYSSTENQDDSE